MNTETGKIYRTLAEVEAARMRGEPLVPLSRNMEAAHIGGNRKQRRIAKAERRRAERKGRNVSKSLEDMTEPELRAQMSLTCEVVKMSLPPGSGFIVLCATFGKVGIAQYGSNVQREDAEKWMIETIHRWNAGDFVPRD